MMAVGLSPARKGICLGAEPALLARGPLSRPHPRHPLLAQGLLESRLSGAMVQGGTAGLGGKVTWGWAAWKGHPEGQARCRDLQAWGTVWAILRSH